MNNLGGAKNPTPSKPGEYNGRDGEDSATIVTEVDPALELGAMLKQKAPVTIAEAGRTLPGTLPAAPANLHQIGNPVTPTLPPQQRTVITELGDPGTISDSPLAAADLTVGVKIVLTGQTGAGKSVIAKQLGLQEIQIDDVIREIYQRFFPGTQPDANFINTLIAWGEGAVDPKIPATPARMMFVDFWRKNDQTGLALQFGQRGYWQNLLGLRVQQATAGVAITTCTDQVLLNELKKQGFAHFHVACSQQSLAQRKRRQGANDQLAVAFTNQLIREVSMRPQGNALPVIWNDTVPAPSPRFLTLETARQVILQSSQNQQVITGE